MSVFFEIFDPGRRHLEEERNRLEWTRDEEGEGDPHRGPIDLDGGVVSIKVSGDGPEPEPEPEPEPPVTRTAARESPRSEP